MAANYQVSPPERFNFTQPREWPKWIRRFERFRTATELSSKGEEVQVNTLIYSMGDEADDILRSFKLSDEDKKKYSVVKAKFDAHFITRTNVIYERAKFNRRTQQDGESVDTFITDLFALAEHCAYKELHDEMIKDRIVVGLRDTSLAEKLPLDEKLTLEKAITRAREAEAVRQQQPVVRGEETKKPEIPVGAIQKGKFLRGKPPHLRSKGGTPQQRRQTSCHRCGKTPVHDRQRCPAKDAICNKCGKKGHYQRVCRSNNVRVVDNDPHSQEDAFLGTVGDQKENPWEAKAQLNGAFLRFQIDTGVEVSVISERDFQRVRNAALLPTQKHLRGPNRERLPLLGQFTGTIHIGNRVSEQTIYVIQGLQKPLLGQPAITALQILKRVGAVKGVRPEEQFPQLFTGLGKLNDEYTIRLKEGAHPFALNTPRRVPVPLMESVKSELERMEKLGVISPVETLTDWYAGMVVVPKSGGRVRICVDLTKLNESVYRERHPLPAVEQTLAQIAGARVFSKLDANSGFWQIPLSKESALLTTFITPYGRYCFNHLPFGIISAPEHFQRRMSVVLRNLEGVVCLIDDILVHGKTQQEHDERLYAVLERLAEVGLTLNKEKCAFSQKQVKFLGQILTAEGVQSDPDKVAAIVGMREPTSVKELRRFLGMVNQLSKFTPHLAEITKPLRDLLSKKNQWTWDQAQNQAFTAVKEALTKSPNLALFDPNLETTVSADASSYGLGAVLLQTQPNGERRAVAYVSRSMTPTETRYAQIEKEALALTWACERYSDYLIGLRFSIETDHKPLVPLFSAKLLDELPIRVQRFRMRMMRYDFTITHVPGKNLITADALSRAPSSPANSDDQSLQAEVDAYILNTLSGLPATERRLEEIKCEQEKDKVCQLIKKYCKSGWPNSKRVPEAVRKFYPVASELSEQEGLLLRNNRLVIPVSLQREVLDQLHAGHQGIKKCRERAKQAVWWPGLSKKLETLVNNCPACYKLRSQRAQPLISTPLPNLPWQKVATDLFEWQKNTYLLIIDYFSRWIEIAKLTSLSSNSVIAHTKSIFARHGILEVVISDNGPQFASADYRKFAQAYQFEHITSSPNYPQGNGEAERGVQIVKNLLKKSEDPYLALMAYRSTPLEVGYSPSELLMSRRLRTTVPISADQRVPKAPDLTAVRMRDERAKSRQKRNFDAHRGARDLPTLSPGEWVWLPDRQESGRVVDETAPRSYVVDTPEGIFRRNRQHLIAIPEQLIAGDIDQTPSLSDNPQNQLENRDNAAPSAATTKTYQTRSRSNQTPKPPDRFDNSWM